jgi:hypothetical protein
MDNDAVVDGSHRACAAAALGVTLGAVMVVVRLLDSMLMVVVVPVVAVHAASGHLAEGVALAGAHHVERRADER